ncbi:p26 [Anthurium mosaic-associated virus]|uniref:p26 n=1 Tax=Anthurium mosaic-associated virus TaxID=664255 RepID=D9U547_9VIRU|nr:p26 [Anthurium mosaic-associated virus]ACU11567.1 p26 [Anthurium mosaic-associated virus]
MTTPYPRFAINRAAGSISNQSFFSCSLLKYSTNSLPVRLCPCSLRPSHNAWATHNPSPTTCFTFSFVPSAVTSLMNVSIPLNPKLSAIFLMKLIFGGFLAFRPPLFNLSVASMSSSSLLSFPFSGFTPASAFVFSFLLSPLFCLSSFSILSSRSLCALSFCSLLSFSIPRYVLKKSNLSFSIVSLPTLGSYSSFQFVSRYTSSYTPYPPSILAIVLWLTISSPIFCIALYPQNIIISSLSP